MQPPTGFTPLGRPCGWPLSGVFIICMIVGVMPGGIAGCFSAAPPAIAPAPMTASANTLAWAVLNRIIRSPVHRALPEPARTSCRSLLKPSGMRVRRAAHLRLRVSCGACDAPVDDVVRRRGQQRHERHQPERRVGAGTRDDEPDERDRKSTRLNSSHANISY